MSVPEVKPISGHNGCLNIQRYVEGKSGERVVAQDFLNICAENGRDRLPWSQQMDETRRLAGNDKPVMYDGSLRRAICYTHYVINPDPRDEVDLETLRDLTMTWVSEHFGSYEVAVTYHDDSRTGTYHAHIVINNTNLETGRRWSSDFKKRDMYRLNNALQNLALERGLSAFSSDHVSMNEGEMTASGKNVSTLGGRDRRWREHRHEAQSRDRRRGGHMPRPATVKSGERRRDTRRDALTTRGEWSWVEEVADAVDVARRLARTEDEFLMVLARLGITVRENAKGTDWLYVHPSSEARAVSGRRLGRVYTRGSLRTGFALGYVGWMQRRTVPGRAREVPQLTREQVEIVLSSMTVVACGKGLEGVSAAQVAALLDYNAERAISGLSDYGRGPRAVAMRRLAERVGLFDEAALDKATRLMRSDVRTVADWIMEERSARGEGGSPWTPSPSLGEYRSEPWVPQRGDGGREAAR